MAKVKQAKKVKESRFAKFSLFFFDHPKISAFIWIELIIVGILSFTFLLPREGFPPVQFPLGVASGTYFVDDAEKVDQDVTKKIAEAAGDVEGIERLDTVAGDNFFSVVASYSSDLTSESGNKLLEEAISEANVLPKEANIEYTVISPSQFLNEYDALISVYTPDGQSAAELEKISTEISKKIDAYGGIKTSETVSQFDTAVNPFTGQEATIQSSFAGVGLREGEALDVHRSSTIGVTKEDNLDIIELSEVINEAVNEINQDEEFSEVGVVIGADYAENIETQIDSLAENLITALIVVAIISFLLIGWRASVITAVIMVTVLLTTMFLMFLSGETLNTITLFALVLALGLFVDDATIIIEAISAKADDKSLRARDVVKVAITKVGSASFAGTMTTVLMFTPLIFVSGILGEFIRILPITVITALITSFVLSVSLIPFLTRLLVRNGGDKQATKPHKPTIINRAEDAVALKLQAFVNLAKRGRKTAIWLSLAMVAFSVVFMVLGGMIGSKVKFNIFPPNKDANQLSVSITYAPNTTIEQAEAQANDIAEITKSSIGGYVDRMSIGASQPADNRSSDILIELVPFTDREIKSPELNAQLTAALETYDAAVTRVTQIDSGPPADQFPFKVQVYNEDPEAAIIEAKEIQAFLEGGTATRQNGTTANITGTKISYVEDVARRDGDRFVQVEASYDDTDTTALVVATQEDVEEKFGTENLKFDFGFESENQESFSSLPLVGLIALIVIVILLSIQFRSIVQPLLVLIAIPFSFFGVMLGLYVTDNPLSFFVMIGFFGLIGISLNNTIIMTDYANQERRSGKRIVDSASSAIKSRFRPLLTTTTIAVAALLPLAMSDPFWESLAYTIIFGIVSSTVFVILSFPFYYMLVEGMRSKTTNWWRGVRSK